MGESETATPILFPPPKEPFVLCNNKNNIFRGILLLVRPKMKIYHWPNLFLNYLEFHPHKPNLSYWLMNNIANLACNNFLVLKCRDPHKHILYPHLQELKDLLHIKYFHFYQIRELGFLICSFLRLFLWGYPIFHLLMLCIYL